MCRRREGDDSFVSAGVETWFAAVLLDYSAVANVWQICGDSGNIS